VLFAHRVPLQKNKVLFTKFKEKPKKILKIYDKLYMLRRTLFINLKFILKAPQPQLGLYVLDRLE
jgi:hypothetical protein